MDKEKVTQIAKFNFPFFCKVVLGMDIGAHHKEWAELLRVEKRVLIESARGHGKSWFISKAYPLWLVWRNIAPVDMLVVSFSEKQAIELLKMVSEEVMRNPNLAHLRPTKQTTWQSSYLEFPNGCKVRGVGFGTSVRGLHPTHIIVDDPLKDEGGMNPEDQYNYFMGALSGTAVRHTQIVVIGTPLDSGDLLEQLESNSVYNFKSYPAIKDGVALFPRLYTIEELRKREEEVGSLAFSREYLLQRVDPKTQVFNDQMRTINTTFTYPEDLMVVRTIIDPAISEKEKACDSAIVTVAQDGHNHWWEKRTRLEKSDNPKLILDKIIEEAKLYCSNFSDYAIVIESELFQKVLAFDLRQQLIEQNLNIRVIEVSHQGIQGKHQRIVGLQPKWEGRAIHLLPGSPLIDQFRFYRPNIKGARIDGLDALAWFGDERVNVPYIASQPVIGEISEEARS